LSRSVRLAVAAAACALGVAVAATPASAKVTWVCNPGEAADVCSTSLTTTRISPTGEVQRVDRVRLASNRKADCFYVYPTVSNQPGPQATFAIDPEIRSIALYQAARYSQYCRVFAPVYRQITIGGLGPTSGVTAEMRETAYQDVLTAWREYLQRYNKGRGVVFISHSQGTFVLRRLLAEEVEKKASQRRRVISALLMGGNVLVKQGSDRGGDFQRLRACRSRNQVGCVIAFSTFNAPVPAESRFGRSNPGATRPGGLPVGEGTQVLCTNPASLGGGAGNIDPISPTEPFAPGTVIGALTTEIGFALPKVSTPWVVAPDSHRARCSSEGGANVLQISSLSGAPVLHALPDPTWGLHLADANIALGNLLDVVHRQIDRYTRDDD
jgi:Protein of unknown function (DUF3089)